MFFRPWVILLLVLTLCVASAARQTATKGQPTSADVILTENDNGKDIDLTTGSTLAVKLPGNPSTGYRWSVAGEPSPLKLQKASFHKRSKAPNAVGSAGTEIFQFTAKSPGMASLTLVYRRSWEYNIAPVKTFTVRVNVR